MNHKNSHTITAQIREWIQKTIRSLDFMRDDDVVVAFNWINLCRFVIFFGVTIRFGLFWVEYEKSPWLMMAELLSLSMLFMHILATEYLIAKKAKPEAFLNYQIYMDWFLMSALYLLARDSQSDLFLILALPLLLSSGRSLTRQWLIPLLFCSSTLLLATIIFSSVPGDFINLSFASSPLITVYVPRQLFLLSAFWISKVARIFRARLAAFSPQVINVAQKYEELGAVKTLDDICTRIIKNNIELLGGYAGHIRLLDNRNNELVLAGGVGAYANFATKRKRVGTDIAGMVAKEKKPRLALDLNRVPHFQRMKDNMRKLQGKIGDFKHYLDTVKSEFAIPLKINGTIYGIVIVQSKQTDHPSPEQISFLETHMNESIKELLSSDLLLKTDIKKLIGFALDLEKNFKDKIHQAMDIFQSYAGQVKMIDEKCGEMVYIAGEGPIEYLGLSNPREKIGSDIFSAVIKGERTYVVQDIQTDPHFRRLKNKYQEGSIPADEEFRQFLEKAGSEVIIPLKANGSIIGCAALVNPPEEEYGSQPNQDRKKGEDFLHLMNQVTESVRKLSTDIEVPLNDLISFCINFREIFVKRLKGSLKKFEAFELQGQIRLWHEQRGELVLIASEEPFESFGYSSLKKGELKSYDEILEKGGRHFNDRLQERPDFGKMRSQFTEYENKFREYERYLNIVRSEYVVPLQVEGRIIGTATVQSDQHGLFTLERQRLFLNSMRYAAIVIERADFRLKVQELQSRIKDITSTEDLTQLLKDLALASIDIIGADIVGIFQYDKDRGGFTTPGIIDGVLIYPEFAAGKIRKGYIPEVMVRKNIKEFFAKRVEEIPSKLGEAKLLEWVKKGEKGFVNRERIESAAGLLLEAKGDILGVMYFNFRQEHSFPDSRKDLMRIFASQAAIAIRNARLFKLSDERKKRLALLREIQTRLIKEVDPQRDLQRILEEAMDLFGVKNGHIRLFVPERGVLILKASHGEYKHLAEEEVKAGESVSGRLIINPQPIIVSDAEASEFRNEHEMEEIRNKNRPLYEFREREKSFACLPLMDGKELAGSLCLSSTVKNTFNEGSKHLLEELADYCEIAMVAIRNAQAHKKAIDRYYKLKRLNEASYMMQENLDLDKKIAIILTATTVQGGLEFNRAMLFISDEGQKTLKFQLGIGPDDQKDADKVYKNTVWKELEREKDKDLLHKMDEDWGIDKCISRDSKLMELGRKMIVSLNDKSQSLVEVFDKKETQIKKGSDLKGNDILHKLDVQEFALAPLLIKKKAIGVLFVDNRFNYRPIGTPDLLLLELFADQAAIAIQNYRDAKEREEMFKEQIINLSHNTLSPLGAISAHANIVAYSASSTDKNALKSAVMLRNEVERLANTIRNYSNFSKSGRGILTRNLARVDIYQLLKDTVSFFELYAKDKNIKLEKEIPEKSVKIILDPDQIRDVLINLIKNAIQAIPKIIPLNRRIVRIGICEEDKFLRIWVEDFGVGMEENEIQYLFRPVQSKKGGAGIGLAISKRIVDMHGGTLTLEGTAVNKGSKFVISLPKEVGDAG